MANIFALASGRGVSGVAVIRVSGRNALESIRRMTRVDEAKIKGSPRKLYYTGIHCSLTSNPIDRGLVVYFPGPNSFTGEDVVE